MSVCTLTSAGHSPGLTTAAVALTAQWPRPAFLVEADASKTSTVLAGYFRGQVAHETGLLPLLREAGQEDPEPGALLRHSVEIAPERRVIPGFASLGAARGAGNFWERFMGMLTALGPGSDVLIDAGRLPERPERAPLLTRADLVLLATGATLPDVAALLAPVTPETTALSECRDALAGHGRADRLRLLVIERARDNYSEREIQAATGVSSIGRIPWLPGASAIYSSGAPHARRIEWERHRLAIRAITQRMGEMLSARQALLHQPATQGAAT